MIKSLVIAALLASILAAATAQEPRGIWGPNKHEAMIQPVVRSPELPQAQRITLTCAIPQPAAGQAETERCTFLRDAIPQAFDPSARETLITCTPARRVESVNTPKPTGENMLMCGFYLDGKTPGDKPGVVLDGALHPPLPDNRRPIPSWPGQ